MGELIDNLCSIYNKKVTIEYSGSTEGDLHGIYADTSLMMSLFELKKVVILKAGLKDMLMSIDSKK